MAGIFRRTYLLYFSGPAADRPLFRAIGKRTVRSVVELGIGSLNRTQRILEIAGWRPESQPIRYCGIDLFDARDEAQPQLALKQAFAELQSPGVKLQLVPGSPGAALKRVANSLTHTDMLLIDASHDAEFAGDGVDMDSANAHASVAGVLGAAYGQRRPGAVEAAIDRRNSAICRQQRKIGTSCSVNLAARGVMLVTCPAGIMVGLKCGLPVRI